MCPSLDGGWGRILVNLANAFQERDLDVHFLVDDDSGSFNKFLNPSIEIHPLKTTHTISGIPYFSRHMLQFRPDVILTTVVRHTALACRVKRLTGLPSKIFPTIHNTYSEKFRKLSARKFRSRIKKVRKYYPQCDKIVAVSEGVKEDFCALSRISPEIVKTIYNPVVDESVAERASIPIDDPWFQTGEPPVILSAGRLEKAKNFPLLIRSFELLRKRTRCRLIILGDGGEFDNLNSMARESGYSNDIALPGHVENPFAYMKQASLFALSSLWEGLPTVLIEAMAIGCPVVSTDCPSGPREILLNGKYGRVVPINDQEKLAKAMLETLENPLPSEILKKRASEFTVSKSVKNYFRLFGLIHEESEI